MSSGSGPGDVNDDVDVSKAARLSKNEQIVNRRMKVYELFLAGFTEAEIAKALKPRVNVKTIERDLAGIKQSNIQWYQRNKDTRSRIKNALKVQVDTKRQIMKYAYALFSREGGAVKDRLAALGLWLKASESIDTLMGLAGQSMLNSELLELQETLDAELKGIRAQVNLSGLKQAAVLVENDAGAS